MASKLFLMVSKNKPLWGSETTGLPSAVSNQYLTHGPGTGSWRSYGTRRGSQFTHNLINSVVDPDPHQSDELDPEPDPHQGDKSNPDPQQSDEDPQHCLLMKKFVFFVLKNGNIFTKIIPPRINSKFLNIDPVNEAYIFTDLISLRYFSRVFAIFLHLW